MLSRFNSTSRELPVFLNGRREYVQGSQMIALCASYLSSEIGFDLRLIEFLFNKITDNLVSVSFNSGIVPRSTNALGRAIFLANNLPLTAQFSDRGIGAKTKNILITNDSQPLWQSDTAEVAC